MNGPLLGATSPQLGAPGAARRGRDPLLMNGPLLGASGPRFGAPGALRRGRVPPLGKGAGAGSDSNERSRRDKTYLRSVPTLFAQNAKNAGITKFTSNVSDKTPERMYQEYPIAPLSIFVHDSNQTSLGSRTVTLTANLDRAASYSLDSPARPAAAITYLAGIARTELLNVFSDLGLANADIFVSDCSYSFTAKRNVSLTATAQYLQTR